MIDFWDAIHFEKLQFIYESEYEFTNDELKELAFEYQRAKHKVQRNKRRKWCYLLIYLTISGIITWGNLFYFQGDHDQRLSLPYAQPVFTIIAVASISVFIIDLIMIVRFIQATSRFVKQLYDSVEDRK